MNRTVTLPEEEKTKQYEYISRVRGMNAGSVKRVYVQTFGCQQNEADSESLLGMAISMGYEKTEKPDDADLIIVNTCAVREHAELKALSITGTYKHIKAVRPGLIIGICGCMVSQEHRLGDIKTKYPYVDFVLGTTLIHRFPETLYELLSLKKRVFRVDVSSSVICEGLPTEKDVSSGSAWVSVMYGCNNFCTYCIVPYVRGRERSRSPKAILAEVKDLIGKSVKEITLLGQNVNSYRPETPENYTFPDLLTDICALEGECVIHFMTSHPKDATERLIDVMAANPPEKGKVGISRRFHLPLQSGSDRVLKAMNRRYGIDHYMHLIDYMREKMPDITITTDIIVGFPTETEEEFSETLSAIERIRYDNIYSFIYSKRRGTPAAEMEDQIPEETKSERFSRLIALQSRISLEKNRDLIGKTVRGLVEGKSKTDETKLTARTGSNRLIHFEGDDTLIGTYVDLIIEDAEMHSLTGHLATEIKNRKEVHSTYDTYDESISRT